MLDVAMSHESATETAQADSREVVEFLRDPGAYPEGCREVELRETHISWVFLTERFVYKIKKPVRFDFLDFSTLPLRRHACREEVRLNRRLAPEVYLSVTPIRRTNRGQLRLGGNQGPVVEWAVAMKRLPDQQRLDQIIASEQGVPESAVEALGDLLAQFYAAQAPVLLRASEYLERLEQHIRQNLSDLRRRLPAEQGDRLELLTNRQLRYMSLFQDLLGNRVCDGCIVDGHGDLRPDHVYLGRQPVVIDCVEFNAEYRCNDILDDLAFLAMECDRLGATEIGRAILQQYRRASRDPGPEQLVDFYKTYRACVRAKVALLRSEQDASCRRTAQLDCEEHLRLAEQYARSLGGRLVVLVGGLMGAGKTTVARQIAEACCCPHLQTDAVRRELQGEPAADQAAEAYGGGRYQRTHRDRVYQALMRQAAEVLQRSATVVLDGSFSQRDWREAAVRLAEDAGARVWQVQCRCPLELAAQRIEQRRQAGPQPSDARPDLLAQQQQDSDPPLSSQPLTVLDTSTPPVELLGWIQSAVNG